MIDYRELLKKYMDHVLVEEGTTFIDQVPYNKDFSKEEQEALRDIYKDLYVARVYTGPITRSPTYNKQIREMLVQELVSMRSATILADTPK